VFGSPEALAAGRAPLSAAVPNVVLRAVGPALLVWTRSRSDPSEDAESLAAAHAVRTKRIEATLSAAGGRFYGHDTATLPVIECAAPDPAAAQRIEASLQAYQAGARSSMAIPAPWAANEQPTAALRLARRTFQIAMTAQESARVDPSSGRLLWSLFFDSSGKNYVAKLHTRQLRAVDKALAAERALGPIDEDVARLVVAKISAPPSDEQDRADDDLRTRLGATATPGNNEVAYGVKVARDGARLRIEILYMVPAWFDATIPPLLAWLCAQSCSDPRLVIETR
jgi:hypothetical protein